MRKCANCGHDNLTVGYNGQCGAVDSVAGDSCHCQHDEQRYGVMSDDSGHDYYIRVQDVDLFEAWVEYYASEDDGPKYNGPDFTDNRIDGTFTFTDPRCE